jgi:hypothetical protein
MTKTQLYRENNLRACVKNPVLQVYIPESIVVEMCTQRKNSRKEGVVEAPTMTRRASLRHLRLRLP